MLTFGAAARLPRPGRPARTTPTTSPTWSRRCSRPGRAPPASRRGASFVVYADDTAVADEARLVAATRRSRAAGIEVVEVLRVDDGRWFAVLPGRAARRPTGRALRRRRATRSPPRRVLDGRVTHGSREELAATLDPDPTAVAAVDAAALAARRRRPPAGGLGARRCVAGHAAARHDVRRRRAAAALAGLARRGATDGATRRGLR